MLTNHSRRQGSMGDPQDFHLHDLHDLLVLHPWRDPQDFHLHDLGQELLVSKHWSILENISNG